MFEEISFTPTTLSQENNQRSMLDVDSHPFLPVGSLKPHYFPKTVLKEDHVVRHITTGTIVMHVKLTYAHGQTGPSGGNNPMFLRY